MAISTLSPPVYYLAKSAVKSTAILWAIAGRICSPESCDIVFGKETAIELLVLDSLGNIQSICEQSVFGNIQDMKLLPYNAEFRSPCVQSDGLDLILVLSDSGNLSILTFSSRYRRFVSINQCQVSPSGIHYRHLGCQLAVDDLGRGVAISAFEDRVAILPASISSKKHVLEKPILYPHSNSTEEKGYKEEVHKRVTNWGVVLSMSFIVYDGTEVYNSSESPLGSESSSLFHLALAVLLMRKDGSYWEIQFLSCDTERRIISVQGRFAPIEGPIPTHIVSVPYSFSSRKVLLFRCGDIILINVSSMKKATIVARESLNFEKLCRGSKKKEKGKAGMEEDVDKDCDMGLDSLGWADELKNSWIINIEKDSSSKSTLHPLYGNGSISEEISQKKEKDVLKGTWKDNSNHGVHEHADAGIDETRWIKHRRSLWMDVDDDNSSPRYYPRDIPFKVEREVEETTGGNLFKRNGFNYLKRYLMRKRGKKKEKEKEEDGEKRKEYLGGKSELENEKGKQEDEELTKSKKLRSNLMKITKKSKVGNLCIDSEKHDVTSTPIDFVTSWSWERDVEGNRLHVLISTALGRTNFLSLILDKSHQVKLRSFPSSFRSSPLHTLLSLPNGVVLSSSLNGDGYCLSVDFKRRQILTKYIFDTYAPISDFCFVNSAWNHQTLSQNQNQSQLLACCGIGERGSLKLFENGIPVEKLLSTEAIYPFVNGIWSVKKRKLDSYHSFLVMSFLKETRVLSVGLNFKDITDEFGFHPSVYTLTCGRIEDEWIAQVSPRSVLICKPFVLSQNLSKISCTTNLHGNFSSAIESVEWIPKDNDAISIGAIGEKVALISKSKSNSILVLKLTNDANGKRSLVENQSINLETQISCLYVSQEGQDENIERERNVEQKELRAHVHNKTREVDNLNKCMDGGDGGYQNHERRISNAWHQNSKRVDDLTHHNVGKICSNLHDLTCKCKESDTTNSNLICLAGTYSSTVVIMSVNSHREISVIAKTDISSSLSSLCSLLPGSIPESLIWGTQGKTRYLLVGLRNGALLKFRVSFDENEVNECLSIEDQKHSGNGLVDAERKFDELCRNVIGNNDKDDTLIDFAYFEGDKCVVGGNEAKKEDESEVDGRAAQPHEYEKIKDEKKVNKDEQKVLSFYSTQERPSYLTEEDVTLDEMDEVMDDHVKFMDIDPPDDTEKKVQILRINSNQEEIVHVTNVSFNNALNIETKGCENSNSLSNIHISPNSSTSDDYAGPDSKNKALINDSTSSRNPYGNLSSNINENIYAYTNVHADRNMNENTSKTFKTHKKISADMHPNGSKCLDSTNLKDSKSTVKISLIGIRKLGTIPVSLIPFEQSLKSDLMCICNRSWLLKNPYHDQNITYSPISFFPTTTLAAPVCFNECKNGVVFIAENSFHLVELSSHKKLSTHIIPLGMTPRHIIHHFPSNSIILLLSHLYGLRHHSNNINPAYNLDHSEIRLVDAVTCAELDKYKLEKGESALSLHTWKPSNQHLMVVGTTFRSDISKHGDTHVCSENGESCGRGRILVFEILCESSSTHDPFLSSMSSGSDLFHINNDSDPSISRSNSFSDWLQLKSNSFPSVYQRARFSLLLAKPMLGAVTSTCAFLKKFLLVAAGNSLICYSRKSSEDLLHGICWIKTRFAITKVYAPLDLNQIYVSDCNDGVLLYSFDEDQNKFILQYSDCMHRLVGDFSLFSSKKLFVSDRKSNFVVLTNEHILPGSPNPEKNFLANFHYHLGEISLRNQKNSSSFHFAMDDKNTAFNFNKFSPSNSSIIVSTMAGSILSLFQLSKEEYEFLTAVEERLSSFFLTSPLLGNDHSQYRSIDRPPGAFKVLDGDMLAQFLELPIDDQSLILSQRPVPSSSVTVSLWDASGSENSKASSLLDSVLHVLEKIHQSF